MTASLTSCIRLLRRVLGAAPPSPYIATVHRIGYRFVVLVTTEGALLAPEAPRASASPPPPLALSPPPLVVGRQGELAQLHTGWGRALHGERQTLFITGEAGIGKTTLIEAFVAQLAPAAPLWLGRGQCIEHYGPGEAYLPLLDALGRLGRGPGGAALVEVLRQYAPTWLAQLPALCRPEDLAALERRVQDTTHMRMLRELVEALEVLTAAQPLVLVLEDLHWSDASTVELLALLARRREAARLLVLGTYRPVEVIVHAHPLKTVKQELVAHGQATELPLGGLGPEAVMDYLVQREDIAAHEWADVAAWVYRRTEGHPLFMVQVVDALARQGLPQGALTGHARSARAEEARARAVPPGLRDLLEAQLGRLGATEQQVLEGGSVAGAEFAVASVAAGMPMALEAVEAVCEGLARQGQFLEDRGLAEWPDGTVSGRYGFRHALYQEVVYQRLGAGRQARWHRVVGARLEQAYGVRTQEVAAELALHFQRGHDAQRAVQYLGQAAANAAQRQAHHEVIELLTTGLELLATLPETPARAQQELDLQLALGPALTAAKGLGAPEVEQTYARARILCVQVGETPRLFPTLVGLCHCYLNRGALPTARELGEQLYALVQREATSGYRLEAHEVLGTILYQMGSYGIAWTHFEQGIALLDSAAPRRLASGPGVKPGLWCLAVGALVLWCLGYPAQAVQRSQEALTLAQAQAHPQSLAMAQHLAAALHYRRREASAVQTQAEALLTLATAQEFPHMVGWGTFWQGWALTMHGQRVMGLAQMHQGMQVVLATGQELSRTYCRVLLADAAGQVGQVEEGLRLLAEALTMFEAGQQGELLAEAYRLQGEFLLCQAVPEATQAEACFQQALEVARRQQTKSFELRAASSLSRLWQQQGKYAAARELLAPLYSWFTEGFDTPDLQEAQALLDALS